ncbi:MAG TPA: 2-oxoglutarate dehydrogenase complex dihydrolipoyllysine-residue succinyltransferase [Candidatus Hydrogenedentes bacterium]|nr:2-oxoglutarate dehydrogenase complex dihydrolipoyllysine-residue succinyltransferase [Candidatus Hydrogenedentota bacterium]HOS02542.1 2-oxoglutarate dehydrogenase complex dihydrolipoyllysine-residue succinyltransferase [Candidatus Hydrogenedentota bacterium]
MTVEVKVPEMGESIHEVQIGRWLVQPGATVAQDEPIVEIESDKATVEVSAPVAGTLVRTLKQTGETAGIGEIIAHIDATAPAPVSRAAAPPKSPKKKAVSAAKPQTANDIEAAADEPQQTPPAGDAPPVATTPFEGAPRIMPSARRVMAQYGLGPQDVQATGPGGRIQKSDVLHAAKGRESVHRELPPAAASHARRPAVPAMGEGASFAPPAIASADRADEIVPMTPMRRRIAERLVQAQQTAALLTTFNEVDMSAVIALRDEHKREFLERHGVKLGFMSFFVKASVAALKATPEINAEIHDADIVYHKHYDIGIAIGGGKGLVVPVLRDADRMTFLDIEKAIAGFAERAQANRIALEELRGGTFTISNGGIYGSLLSTPIVNPPQSGILGMHAIQDRPVAREGQVVIRPMMYVALTYDHRIVDGREAVTFLRRIKEDIEAPARLMLEL